MPIYWENILENESLEPFSLNQYEIWDWLRREAMKMSMEEYEFFSKYLDVIDDINDIPR